jgi:hypothetical protein
LERLNGSLTLPLLVFGIFAQHAHDALAPDDFTLVAHLFD